jgi:hypothetical protein
MDEKRSVETVPIAMIVERRRQRAAEMSCSEIMKILRKRAAKAARREGRVIDSDPK